MSASLRLEVGVDKPTNQRPSVLWHFRGEESMQPVKIEWWDADVVICLEQSENDVV